MANEKRLIDANALKKAIWNTDCDVYEFCEGRVTEMGISRLKLDDVIDDCPTVDAVEVVHARWRWGYNSMNQYGAWCAECECGWEDKGTNDDFIRVQGLVIAHKYCPNCGAKMDGGNDDA